MPEFVYVHPSSATGCPSSYMITRVQLSFPSNSGIVYNARVVAYDARVGTYVARVVAYDARVHLYMMPEFMHMMPEFMHM